MDVNVWNETYWWVNVVWNILLVVVPVLAALAATSAFGAAVIRTFKTAWKEWVRPAVDDPSDPLVKLLAEKTGLPAEVISDFLVENLDLLTDLLPKEELAAEARGRNLLSKLRGMGLDL